MLQKYLSADFLSILKSAKERDRSARAGNCGCRKALDARGIRAQAAAVIKTLGLIAFVALFAVCSVRLKTELRRDESPVAALKIGEPMPDFTLPDANGQPVQLSEVTRTHKLVVINFWDTWCGPCRMEMPSFEKLYTAKKDEGFMLLAVNEDTDPAERDAYLKRKPVSFPVLFDRDGADPLAKRLKITALPTTVLVGGDRKIQQVNQGVEPYLQYSVQRALEKKPSP